MKKLKKNKILILTIIGFIIISFVNTILIAKRPDIAYIKENYGSIFLITFDIFSIVASIFIQIFLHELGHSLAAIFSGYDFIFFRLGSFAFVKKNGKLKIAKFEIPGTGGQALFAPKGKAYENFPYKLYMYAGIISNLFFSILAFIIMYFNKNYFLDQFSYFFASVGIYIFLTNGLKIDAEISNDAMQVKLLERHEEYRIFTKYNLKIARLLVDGKEIKDMDQDEIDFILSCDNQFAEIGILKGDYYSQNLDLDKAKEEYEKALDKEILSDRLQKQALINEIIYLSIIKKDQANYEKYVSKEFEFFLDNFLLKLVNGYYTKYAKLLLIDKDQKAAEKLKTQYIRFRKNYIFESEIRLADKKIQIVDQLAKEVIQWKIQ